MKIYCISGLGADFRMFQNLKLEHHNLVYLDWIPHLDEESLPAYALRLGEGIDQSEPHAIMGLSFGGMLAVEIAKEMKPNFLVIISSATVRTDIPRLYRFFGPLVLRLIPDVLFTKVNRLIYLVFGAKSEREKKNLQRAIENTDKELFRWAMSAILKWRNKTKVDCLRIHGERDVILPVGKAKIDLLLPKGGHLSIVSHANSISNFLNNHV